MIITCSECSSSFNLDDSLIKEKGSKVRCSVCKHIFTVYPPSHEEGIVPEFGLFSDDSTGLEIEKSANSFAADVKDKDSEQFESKSTDISAADQESFSKSSGSQKEWFDIVLDGVESPSRSQDDEWDKQIDEETFLKEDLLMDYRESISDEETFLKNELTSEEEAMLSQNDDRNSAGSQGSNIDEKEDPEEYLQNAEKQKPKSIFSMLVLIIVLIFLLTAGTYVAGIMAGYKIPYFSGIKIPIVQEYIEKVLPKGPEAKPVLNNTIINDHFMTNPTAGTLFIITGQVDNPTEETFNYIELEATLATGEKEKAIIKKVFCGNIISDEMLRNGDIVEIGQILTVREGQNNANINIKPGSSVPFMVVFSELPDKLKTYYIKVISFEKAANRE